MTYERRITLLAIAAVLPAAAAMAALLALLDVPLRVQLSIGGAVLAATVLLLAILRQRVAYPLRTLSNIVAAMRERDYSLRSRGGHEDEDAFAELALELNLLGESLREQRLGDVEATALVRALVGQLDAALFAFDHHGRLQLTNAAGERLLGSSELLGKTVDELGLTPCFAPALPHAVEMRFPAGHGKWSIRRSTFREKGKEHHFLVISDLSRALRDEELFAWQRLVRVLGHELNNSLAPIKSIATSLQRVVELDPLPSDWRDDARRGLNVIASRAEALTRFTQAYARLARLPRPSFAPVDVASIVRRVAALGYQLPVAVEQGPHAVVMADADQLEQALINLIQNGVDASLETGGSVTVTWSVRDGAVELLVADEGPGLSGSLNLFVPFFTTKPGGTGIGLVLSRQIAEAHNGNLLLQNRSEGGCEARLRLPALRQAGESR
ncbi:MAG TPA: ATP-binding protein [Thermoanaerobaculia bacterium]|jgi:nitrogen fixation/metabolism regulation signal transduction histidine kinase